MRVDLQGLPDPAPALEAFRRELRDSDAHKLIRRRIIAAPAYVYPDHDDLFSLCDSIADLLQCHPAAVRLVGSAKLGFSIAPRKRYRHFGDKSDIDAVIVDERLFDRVWHEVHTAVETRVLWEKRGEFAKYLMNGWIRPDMFPDVDGELIGRWWNGFNGISKLAGLKVAGAVYRSWMFLESYQLRAVNACVEHERLNNDAAAAASKGGSHE